MIRAVFFKDFGWKLFSLLLAVFIWYTVHKIIEEPRAMISPANTAVTYRDVPVFLVTTTADMRQFGLNSNLVSVTVSGPPGGMAILEKNQIHATVNLSDFNARTQTWDSPVDVAVPWGVTVISVEPALLHVIPPQK